MWFLTPPLSHLSFWDSTLGPKLLRAWTQHNAEHRVTLKYLLAKWPVTAQPFTTTPVDAPNIRWWWKWRTTSKTCFISIWLVKKSPEKRRLQSSSSVQDADVECFHFLGLFYSHMVGTYSFWHWSLFHICVLCFDLCEFPRMPSYYLSHIYLP